MFITKEYNTAGIYLLKFWVNGLETPVVIDDYLPSKQNRPAFAQAKSGDLWVCLAEKAFAKLFGSYGNTEGGQCIWAAEFLTGLPSFVATHDSDKVANDLEKFWKKILACDKRNFKLTAGSNGQGENRGGNGIISGHAYSVISAFEVNHQGRSHRLVKLRNPWGKSEWNGLWSDSSSIWTP